MKKLRVVSLFSGLGGMDLGLLGGFKYLNRNYNKNHITIKYAMDFEKKFCDIYNRNFLHKCHLKNIKYLNSSEVPNHDILIGGFPCQSFSVLAQNPKRLGYKDEKGKLFFEICRILRDKKPRFFIVENVKGILSANKKKAFPLIISEFEKSGYCIRFKLINSVEFGVPQKRERIFIVGFRKITDFNKFKFPNGKTKNNPIPIKKILEKESTIDDHYYFSKKAINGLKNTKNYTSMNKGRHQNINKPCNTVSSHLAKVSLNSTDPVLLINNKYRMFTPKEVARIQSFPENFILSGIKTIDYKALGNAVPPIVMWKLTKEILKLLKN